MIIWDLTQLIRRWPRASERLRCCSCVSLYRDPIDHAWVELIMMCGIGVIKIPFSHWDPRERCELEVVVEIVSALE